MTGSISCSQWSKNQSENQSCWPNEQRAGEKFTDILYTLAMPLQSRTADWLFDTWFCPSVWARCFEWRTKYLFVHRIQWLHWRNPYRWFKPQLIKSAMPNLAAAGSKFRHTKWHELTRLSEKRWGWPHWGTGIIIAGAAERWSYKWCSDNCSSRSVLKSHGSTK